LLLRLEITTVSAALEKGGGGGGMQEKKKGSPSNLEEWKWLW